MRGPLTGSDILLGRRQLFMLPSRFGLVFSLLLLVMLLAAINYGNGLAYGLTFLLASMGIVSMLYTHRNLYRLRLTPGPCAPVFAGQSARFHLCLHNDRGPRRVGVQVERGKSIVARVDIPANGSRCLGVTVPARRRGYLPAPRLRLSTGFPLGLLYSWSQGVVLEQRCLVYPAPGPAAPLPRADRGETGEHTGRGEGDDFAGLRSYHAGDPPRHVHWKAAARGLGLHTKDFQGARPAAVWLDWDRCGAGDTETRLSQLCRWVLDAEAAGAHYGLRLPGLHIAPGRGPAHRHQCLKALALYEHG